MWNAFRNKVCCHDRAVMTSAGQDETLPGSAALLLKEEEVK
jgi:hypothetical protein